MDPIITTQDLTIRFQGLVAVNKVSLTIEKGERRLLLGPNGAGKTTLFNLISGDLPATSGTVQYLGRDITSLPVQQRALLGIGRTYQILTLFPNDTLLHNVALAVLVRHPARWSLMKPLASLNGVHEEAGQVLDALGLAQYRDHRVSETSYGVRRRLEIAIALAQRPRLLLLDEPLSGLSAEERSDVQKLIAGIDPEVTIIMIEHDVDIALELADKVTLLNFGEVVVEGTRAEVAADPRTKEIYLGR